MAIIDYDFQQTIKPISPNNKARYSQFEFESEENELRDILGIELLQDLQANPDTPNNVVLLDGGTFINCFGNSVNFKGVKFILAYIVYNRYLLESYVNDTYTGFVQKTRTDATQLNTGHNSALQHSNNQIISKEVELLKEFLTLNSSLYPLWNCRNINVKINSPKFTTLNKTHKNTDNHYGNIKRII